jgi:hypothetical protein
VLIAYLLSPSGWLSQKMKVELCLLVTDRFPLSRPSPRRVVARHPFGHEYKLSKKNMKLNLLADSSANAFKFKNAITPLFGQQVAISIELDDGLCCA